jgi:NADPH:quinone reductase-like Zn-dependent oxidoreductase
MLPQFTSGKLKPVVDVVMPMSEVRAAHQRMDANTNFGKIIMAW